MKTSHSLEKKRFHFGHWRLADHGRLSVLLLFFFVLHAVALRVLKVERPLETRLVSFKNPVIQVYVEDEKKNEKQDIAFQLQYQDPSSVSYSSSKNLPSLPRVIPLPIELGSEPLTKVVTSSDFLTELETPNLIEKAANSLRTPLSMRHISIVTNQFLHPSSGVIVIGEEVATRLISALPSLPVQVTDRPLPPTVIRVSVSPNGIVESALVEVSSGSLNLDKEAVKISTKLRFSPDFEKSVLWSTFTFYWVQASSNEVEL